MASLEAEIFGNEEDTFLADVVHLTNDDLKTRIRALDNEIRIMKSDIGRSRLS
jgi:hypothetical protein